MYVAYIHIYYICTLRAHFIFSHTRSVKYMPIFHTLYFTLHRACVSNDVVLTTAVFSPGFFEGLGGGREGGRARGSGRNNVDSM